MLKDIRTILRQKETKKEKANYILIIVIYKKNINSTGNY